MNEQTTQTVEPIRSGDTLTADRLNRATQAINKLVGIGVNPPFQVVPPKPPPSQGAWVEMADACSTANLTLSGTQTVDGVALAAKAVCLARNQSTAAQNGLYTVAAGAWSLVGQPDIVVVRKGTVSALCAYCLSAANTYSGVRGFWG